MEKYLPYSFAACLLMACTPAWQPEPDDNGGKPDNGDQIYDTAWENFVHKTDKNILPDFSYAGYRHGEEAPTEIWDLGYRKYDVTDYGAVPDDDKSDRQAFLDAIDAAFSNSNKPSGKVWTTAGNGGTIYTPSKNRVNAIIYFPAGNYILYDKETDAVLGKSQTIEIRGGNIVLAGAGRDRTSIEMKSAYEPLSGTYGDYAGDMLRFRHWTGYAEKADLAADAFKGDFSVELSSVSGLSSGQWVALTLGDADAGSRGNNDPAVIAKTLAPFKLESRMTRLKDIGVIGVEVHQISSINGNTVKFREPLLRDVKASWGWKLSTYSYYENVGVEDLSFIGHARPEFVHGQWTENSEYGPLSFMRVLNSWVRRVGFHSVTSAISFANSAYCSAYDITIDGNRGHTAINAARSSRLFFGKTEDFSNAYGIKGAGQHHANGVSKWSNGTVIWNCEWGTDSNFESHATQPRATLYDCCKGGFLRGHQGGADSELPNHLDDLVLWNFEATNVGGGTDNWLWWGPETHWRFLPPSIVGFHGAEVHFNPDEVKLNESPGVPVEPLSLYEAQLQLRLGYVPSWLIELE